MTYKSIDIILSEHDGSELVRFVPAFDPDESELREMFCLPALHRWLYQSDRRATANFKANVRAFLGRFVKGYPIDNEDYMKNWKADVWELRVQLQPRREAIRIFGTFPKADVFVAMHQKQRSSFGGKNDPAWDRAIDKVIDDWERLFPGKHRMRARPFSNCVTANAYDHRGGSRGR